MDNFWKEAVKQTGAVAVVGFILALVLRMTFHEKVLEIFGSDRAFYLVVFVIVVLVITLIISIILHKKTSNSNEDKKPSGTNRKVKIDRTKIEGDVVLGDKTINQGSKDDK